MLALIYGASKLANDHQVTGSRLMKAAQQSGLNRVECVDRALSPLIGPFVTAAGFEKGRRYGLTNPGIRRAEEILTGILGWKRTAGGLQSSGPSPTRSVGDRMLTTPRVAQFITAGLVSSWVCLRHSQPFY
jgi:hypothetical protein